MVLEYDPALQAGGNDPLAVQHNVTFVIGLEPDDQPQQRGLSASAGTDDADEFSGTNVEVDLLQYRQWLAFDPVSLAQAADLQCAGLQGSAV